MPTKTRVTPAHRCHPAHSGNYFCRLPSWSGRWRNWCTPRQSLSVHLRGLARPAQSLTWGAVSPHRMARRFCPRSCGISTTCLHTLSLAKHIGPKFRLGIVLHCGLVLSCTRLHKMCSQNVQPCSAPQEGCYAQQRQVSKHVARAAGAGWNGSHRPADAPSGSAPRRARRYGRHAGGHAPDGDAGRGGHARYLLRRPGASSQANNALCIQTH